MPRLYAVKEPQSLAMLPRCGDIRCGLVIVRDTWHLWLQIGHQGLLASSDTGTGIISRRWKVPTPDYRVSISDIKTMLLLKFKHLLWFLISSTERVKVLLSIKKGTATATSPSKVPEKLYNTKVSPFSVHSPFYHPSQHQLIKCIVCSRDKFG